MTSVLATEERLLEHGNLGLEGASRASAVQLRTRTRAMGAAEFDLVRPLEGVPVRYIFKHALIQDVAYNSLLRSDRRHYHQEVAETLLRSFPERVERQPELLAHHLTEASLPGDALEYWLRAAQRSVDRGANAEALRHLERAKAGAATLPDGALRWEAELQIEMLLAQVARATAGYASREVEDSYMRALELCQRLGDASSGAVGTQMLVARVRCGEDFSTRSLARSPGGANRLFWVMWGFGAYHQSRAELSKALDIGNQLVELARGEPALELEGHFGAGSTCYFMGRLHEARAHLEQGWGCFETRRSITYFYGLYADVGRGLESSRAAGRSDVGSRQEVVNASGTQRSIPCVPRSFREYSRQLGSGRARARFGRSTRLAPWCPLAR